MTPASHATRIQNALPFWVTLLLVPLIAFVATQGGWWLALIPLCAWWLFMALDVALGQTDQGLDPDTPEGDLFWHRAITLIWFPLQAAVIFGMIWYATRATHLSGAETVWLFFGVGVLSGTVGITYSHELMHQTGRVERWLADLLLASVLYSHFRTEHLLVHHRHVGTPLDPATARFNEGFHRFFPRVLRRSLRSAFRAEAAMLARAGRPWHHVSNPFWRYCALQAGYVTLAFMIGGWAGVGLFALQAIVAIWQLELTNYVEHYGLTRRHLGGGRYEHVRPHHSWNADHRASNSLLINLQRHSDHHTRPDRRFPLLQAHPEEVAPRLPAGYPLMTLIAMIPPLWKRIMNPRVKAWRRRHYPDIADWHPYNKGLPSLR